MSTNPLDDENGEFYALINGEGQYSLWPTFAVIPAGWTAVYGPGGRQEVLEHVETNWTDMRPRSLVEQIVGGPASQGRPDP